jgi:hypothetical protein
VSYATDRLLGCGDISKRPANAALQMLYQDGVDGIGLAPRRPHHNIVRWLD